MNGERVASTPLLGELQDSNRPLVIGFHPDWNAYSGVIRDVRLYDVALDGGEVAQLLVGGPTPAPRPKALVRLTHREDPNARLNLVITDERVADCSTDWDDDGRHADARRALPPAALEKFRARLLAIGGCARAADREYTEVSLTVGWPGLACDLSPCAACRETAFELERAACKDPPPPR
ncbi:MAG TPA: hypothetical protein VFF06_11095 [Polyangia bacterium]|nr:hypothetical protein [Polyangia bacterium]